MQIIEHDITIKVLGYASLLPFRISSGQKPSELFTLIDQLRETAEKKYFENNERLREIKGIIKGSAVNAIKTVFAQRSQVQGGDPTPEQQEMV